MPQGIPLISKQQENIVASIKASDTGTLQKIYVETYPKVEVHILRNNGTKDQAKDIFQEAMIALWRAAKEDRFTAQSLDSAKGYLYTIAKNKWIDYLRSSRYKKEISSEKMMTNHTIPDKEVEDTDYELKLEQAQSAFKRLGESCKDLLSKFYFDKMSLNEIASLLDLDAASARNKKYRCMQMLRSLALIKPQKLIENDARRI